MSEPTLPSAPIPVEAYTPERKAEFLLSNATSADDYGEAVAEVLELGLDPKKIKHRKPATR